MNVKAYNDMKLKIPLDDKKYKKINARELKYGTLRYYTLWNADIIDSCNINESHIFNSTDRRHINRCKI